MTARQFSLSPLIPLLLTSWVPFSLLLSAELRCMAQTRSPEVRLDRFGDPLPAGALFRLGTTRLRHGSSVTGVCWTPDGQCLASCSWDGVIRLWEAKSARLVREFIGKTRHGSFSIAFSPDGMRLVATGEQGAVRVFEVESGRELFFEKRHVERTFGAAYSPDGLMFATAGSDRYVRLWDPESFKPVLSFLQPHRKGGNSHAVAFSRDGNRVAAGFQGNVLIWSLVDGGPPVVIEKCYGRDVYSLCFLPDGSLVSSGEGRDRIVLHQDDGQRRKSPSFLRVWNPDTGALVREFAVDDDWGNEAACSVSADGRTLVAVFRNALAVYDAMTGERRTVIDDYLNLFGARTHGISVSPDGSHVAAIGGDHVVRIWKTTGEPVHRFPNSHDERVEQVAVSGDSSLYATVSYDGSVSAWRAADGRHLWRRWLGSGGDAGGRAVAFSPDGSKIAAGGWVSEPDKPRFEGHVNVWDARTGETLLSQTVDDRVMAVTFSPDGHRIAIGIGLQDFGFGEGPKSTQAGIVIDAKTGKEIARTDAPRTRLVRLKFSPDGRSLLMADEAMNLHRWVVGEKQGEIVQLTGHERATLRWLAITNDARLLATSDLFGSRIFLRNASDGSAIRTMELPGTRGSVLSFSKDGRVLATASIALMSTGTRQYDTAVRLWDVASGRKLFEMDVAGLRPNFVELTPDGRRLLAGCDDGSTLVLDVASTSAGRLQSRAGKSWSQCVAH